MSTFVEKFVGKEAEDKKTDILIPALQRDYVQGGRIDVIKPFLDSLAEALKGKKTIELNYIYGYEEKEMFVPIDGQQRLITLWLLHLYLVANGIISVDKFPILKFYSREFADDFCNALINHKEVLKNPKEITDNSWFVAQWNEDATVKNMIKTLCCIQVDRECTHVENIVFSYYNIKTMGLTDDVYVKMNGRGRPLSYFENLKSWMDEHCSYEKEEWQKRIDNEWTDLFWENRNRLQSHPEEIDDEQLNCFYSLLFIYWIQNKEQLKENIKNHFQENDQQNEEMMLELSEAFFNKTFSLDKKDVYEELTEAVINNLIINEKHKLYPLFWIENFCLFDRSVYKFIFLAMEKFCELRASLNEISKEYFDISLRKEPSDNSKEEAQKEPSTFYEIALSESTYAKTLPLMYVMVKYPRNVKKDNIADLKGWCRVFKNLILNTEISKDNLETIVSDINIISESFSKNNISVYEFFAGLNKNTLSGFSSEQLAEEIRKAKYLVKNPSEEILLAIEKYESFPLLKGKINCLFKNDGDQVDFDANGLKERFDLLEQLYINSDKDIGKDEYHFVKVLLSKFVPGNRMNKKYPFYLKRNSKNWKILLTNKLINEFRQLEEDKIYDNSCDWIEKLTKSNVLNKARDKGKVLFNYGKKIVLWGTEGLGSNAAQCVVIESVREKILTNKNNSFITTVENKLLDNTCYEEWNVDFYAKIENVEYKFRWNWDDDIYILDSENKVMKTKNNELIKESVRENSPNELYNFEAKLRKLIEKI